MQLSGRPTSPRTQTEVDSDCGRSPVCCRGAAGSASRFQRASHFIAAVGWRQTHIGIGLFCLATMLRSPWFCCGGLDSTRLRWRGASTGSTYQAIGLAPSVTQGLLAFAGLCCCVAMSMPQVHLVAYCGDLGYGPARGAEMLAVMLGFGVASRLIFGWVLNFIGGLPTLLLGSAMQAIALALYLPFNGLVSLFAGFSLFWSSP